MGFIFTARWLGYNSAKHVMVPRGFSIRATMAAIGGRASADRVHLAKEENSRESCKVTGSRGFPGRDTFVRCANVMQFPLVERRQCTAKEEDE